MKRTLKQSQLENMISECVGQVLAESRQPRRQSMNEAQLSRYIQNIINEEMESEGWRGKITGALSGAYKGLKGEVNKAKRGIMDTGLNTEYQGQNLGSRWKTLKNNINTSAQAGDNTEEVNIVCAFASPGFFNNRWHIITHLRPFIQQCCSVCKSISRKHE